MNEITPITDSQQVALNVLRLLNNETASAKKAMDFIGQSALKLELFNDSYLYLSSQFTPSGSTPSPQDPASISARVDVAIENAKAKLSVFE